MSLKVFQTETQYSFVFSENNANQVFRANLVLKSSLEEVEVLEKELTATIIRVANRYLAKSTEKRGLWYPADFGDALELNNGLVNAQRWEKISPLHFKVK